jgi:flavin-dependent dehydrogenase
MISTLLPWQQDGRMWHTRSLQDRYDVVIIGGGVHGLATAYYLARDHGVTDVAVLELSVLMGSMCGCVLWTPGVSLGSCPLGGECGRRVTDEVN